VNGGGANSEPSPEFSAYGPPFAENPAGICSYCHRDRGTSIAALKVKMRFLRRRSTAPADESLLAEVFEAEKAAAARVAEARLEAEAWLNGERLAIANAAAARSKALAAEAAKNEEAARQAAVEDAAKIVADADAFSRDLRAFGDRDLQPLVARHVAAIIPASHPNAQSPRVGGPGPQP
jgi:hypothetical protein